MTNQHTLLIIDGYGFIYRAYHVLPAFTTPSGLAVGALYGFTSMLLKIIDDFKPGYMVVVFDSPGKNFRHQIYDQYKAHRPPVPEDLKDQLALMRRASFSLNLPMIEKVGYEADDIIATLATKFSAIEQKMVIISSDKDLMQLINDYARMYDPIKNQYITASEVVAKFGVLPGKVREVMALIGDQADNIPGVKGIGPKTAAALIQQFGSLKALLAATDQIKNLRQQQLIQSGTQMAELSWQLVGLDCNVECEINLESLKFVRPQNSQIADFLTEYGFKSLYKRAENILQVTIDQPPVRELLSDQIVTEITTSCELQQLIKAAEQTGIITICLVSNQKFAFITASASNQAGIINLAGRQPEGDLLLLGRHQPEENYQFWQPLIELFADHSIKKITYKLKPLLKFLAKFTESLSPKSCEDIELMQYLLSAGLPQNDLFSLTPADFNAGALPRRLAVIAASFEQYYHRFTQELRQAGSLNLYKDIDLPLCHLLNKIENTGIKVDANYLRQLSTEFGSQIRHLEQQIFTQCGRQFNIASPKQLGEVLFTQMQLPFGKISSKAKNYATGVEVLEKLSENGYLVADLLLSWRQLTKLKNTYTDSLPEHINPITGRIHTTFLQNSTSTGRLSSQEPNLQNIPIRSTEGHKIRGAFIAKTGHKLVSADYSQIELRILSHVANVPTLKAAFLNQQDIHCQTASQIFKVSPEAVTQEHRRRAKAINFGIIYGISGFGLAKQLNITASEASEYIKQYFAEYPGILEYMESTKIYARQHGYVKNLFGRKCFVPLINDKNYNLRQLAERAAINAPLQGTNADIIKIAMINLEAKLSQQQLKTKLILQIHDELLYEVPIDEIAIVTPLIKQIMAQASPLSVPTIVEVKIADDWIKVS